MMIRSTKFVFLAGKSYVKDRINSRIFPEMEYWIAISYSLMVI